jgi:hypothetical protein
VEFSYGNGIIESADFTADTHTLAVEDTSGSPGLSLDEVWAFDNLDWSGTPGGITSLVELPGGNLHIKSASFGDDYIVVQYYPVYFDGSGSVTKYSTTFQINAVPVPPAICLFGSGLLGLIGRSGRKRSSRAAVHR